jgi:hypothetical protein
MQTEADLLEAATRLAVFPDLMKFIGNRQVPSEHPVWGLNDGLLRALDFFLSLPELPGIEDQKQRFLRLGRGDGRTNEPESQQASLLTEIRATYLLSKELGAEILGFEQPSPRRQGRGTCDILCKFEGGERFFEVKRKSADVRQKVPEPLVSMLIELEGETGLAITPQLHQRSYNCVGLDILKSEIKKHIGMAPRDDRDVPVPFGDAIIGVLFDRLDPATEGVWGEYLDPDSLQDIERYILGWREEESLKVERKIPMVEECRPKGADYLMSQVGFQSPEEIIKACFREITQLGKREWATKDRRLSELRGIILFGTNLDWCLVRNIL